MRSKQLYEIIDGVAPFALSKEYIARGAYDNSGLLVDCGEVTGVLFSLDLSLAAVEEAKKLGYNCIVTHHPAIFAPIKCLGEDSAVLACARAGISVISAHLNLDAAEGGVDESLMQALGGTEPIACEEQLSAGAYGRVYDVEPQSFEAFIGHAKERLSAERVISYGEGEVRRVASFCGAGFTEGALAFAAANGADTLVSSDAKHHLIAAAVEKGVKVLLLTHYAAEHYGFCRFAEKIKNAMGTVPCAVFTDRRFL